MYFDELPDGPRIPKPAAQRAGVKSGEQIPTDSLVSAVEDGSDIHDSLTRLASRGWNEAQLRELMDRSAAKDADEVRWTKRVGEIPRLVASAARKATKRAEQAFGPQPIAPAVSTDTTTLTLPTFTPADMAKRPIKPRRWIIQDLIPEGEPTLVYGKGAAGKSLVLFQLCVCVASGRKWLERELPVGRALFFTCEDSVDELNRRAASIMKALGIEWRDCADRLLIVPMRGADADAVLAQTSNGVLQATPTYQALKTLVADFQPDIVVVDTLADTFAGNENVRAEAKQFVNMIVRLRIDATHLVTAHLSVSAEEDGRGFSGSTGWPAAVRASLTFGRPKTGRFKDDRDVRVMESKKGNYAAEGAGAILMRWKEGAFVSEAGVAAMAEDDVDALFLRLLAKFTEANRNVSEHLAPSTFYKEPEAGHAGVGKADLKAAMGRLFDARRITNQECKAANGNKSKRLVALDPTSATPWKPSD